MAGIKLKETELSRKIKKAGDTILIGKDMFPKVKPWLCISCGNRFSAGKDAVHHFHNQHWEPERRGSQHGDNQAKVR